MTRLNDDGYLETDDPVVAACFLGQEGLIEGLDDFLDSVGTLTIGFCDSEGNESTTDYPIRIPAATVAEVWDKASSIVIGVLYRVSVDSHVDLLEWLRTHTEDTDDK